VCVCVCVCGCVCVCVSVWVCVCVCVCVVPLKKQVSVVKLNDAKQHTFQDVICHETENKIDFHGGVPNRDPGAKIGARQTRKQ
jgi:hypothetical protein